MAGDGVYSDSVDVPLPGVQFTLTGTSNQGTVVNRTSTTGDDGYFEFRGLPPSVAGVGTGTGYTVTEILPAGFVATTPDEFVSDLAEGQELVAFEGQAMLPPGDPRFEVVLGSPLMFGNTVPGSIHGFKFEDMDGDGAGDWATSAPEHDAQGGSVAEAGTVYIPPFTEWALSIGVAAGGVLPLCQDTGTIICYADLPAWCDEPTFKKAYERAVVLELLTGIKRAGADMILTYFALEAARALNG
mgnify:CR=1 FL=1